MKKDFIIVSDFDGTITTKDTLFTFMENYAEPEWENVEQDWLDGKIGSQECLIKEFELVPNLSQELIDDFLEDIELDPYFKEFNEKRLEKGIDFLIVSDGLDYFIQKILQKCNISNVNIVSNHAEFIDNKFKISYPNSNPLCIKASGTCKCSVVRELKEKYNQVYYIGDGNSDVCVADKADFLFAKSSLLAYCKNRDISFIQYNNYSEVLKYARFGFDV